MDFMSSEIHICIIGAGVVGLAIAAELASPDRKVFVFERNRTFGLETSSHNSEVIHAGIYYQDAPLKARFCVEGNRLLYEICKKYHIRYKNTGKIIVAADEEERREIERLYYQGLKNGASGLSLITRSEIKRLEPNVEAVSGLLSTSTGIIDSHGLMRSYMGRAVEKGTDILFNSEVVGIEKLGIGYRVSIRQDGNISLVTTAIVVNCAGLYSDKVAALAGINIEQAGYKIHFCKGEYFAIDPRVGRLVDRLIYPVPEQAGKGIHITLNLEGQMKLGPNTQWVNTVDYSVDENHREGFYTAAKKYLPAIRREDISPDFAGVRPKLQGPGDEFHDFVIHDESDKGLPGLINLIGIESPGLTSSPAIARYVKGMVEEQL